MGQTWYDDDGSVPREEWGGLPQGYPVDYDRKIRERESERESFDNSEYNKIKRYLDNAYNGISPEQNYSENLEGRILKIHDSFKRDYLLGVLNGKMAQYKRNESEYKEQYQQEVDLEKQQLVQQYKNAWRSRNAIWKLSHQQFNPKKRNLDKMPESFLEKEIENIRKR